MKEEEVDGAAPATPTDTVAVNPTPRPRTIGGKRKGSITRNVGIPKPTAVKATDGRSKAARAKRTAAVAPSRRAVAAGVSSFGQQATFFAGLQSAKGGLVTVSYTRRGGTETITVPASQLLTK